MEEKQLHDKKQPQEKKAGNKESILLLLAVLSKYSSPQRTLTYAAINDILAREYHITYGESTLYRNLRCLQGYAAEFGLEIQAGHKHACISKRPFEPVELHMMINSIIFSKEMTNSARRTLLAKIARLGGPDFQTEYDGVLGLSESGGIKSAALAGNIGLLNKAIRERLQVEFVYNDYDADGKLQPRYPGNPPVRANPYYIVANNGRYYLLCNYATKKDQIYVRVDKISSLQICQTKISRFRREFSYQEVDETKLSKHNIEHLYMYAGKPENIRLRVKPKNAIGDIVDWFGTDFTVLQTTEEYYEVRVKCNPRAMQYWALQFGGAVEVLSPAKLRRELAAAVAEIYQKYH